MKCVSPLDSCYQVEYYQVEMNKDTHRLRFHSDIIDKNSDRGSTISIKMLLNWAFFLIIALQSHNEM